MVTFYAGILKPATVTVPERIQQIYIACRSNEKALNTESDSKARESVIQLKSLLESTGRYVVEVTEIDQADHASGSETPAMLNWAEVERITQSDTTTLLIVLEKYLLSGDASGAQQEQRLWRMYDVATHSLRDEFDHTSAMQQNFNSTSPAVEIYADRIMMHWEWVQRDYYKGGSADMRAAWHCLDSSDWAGAAAKWKLVAKDSLKNPKTAAKACYNMALYCELNGDIAGALAWIARSKKLENVLAVYYGRIIREYSGDTVLLTQQLAVNQGQIPLATTSDPVVYRQPKHKLGGPEPRKVPYDVQEARRKAGVPVMEDPR